MRLNNLQSNIPSIYPYPLTGIFPFTLVRKHILIQLRERNDNREKQRLEEEQISYQNYETYILEKNGTDN